VTKWSWDQLTPKVQLFFKVSCHMNPTRSRKLKIQLDELLWKRCIWPSVCHRKQCPRFIYEKKEGILWLFIDYRELNKFTTKKLNTLYLDYLIHLINYKKHKYFPRLIWDLDTINLRVSLRMPPKSHLDKLLCCLYMTFWHTPSTETNILLIWT